MEVVGALICGGDTGRQQLEQSLMAENVAVSFRHGEEGGEFRRQWPGPNAATEG